MSIFHFKKFSIHQDNSALKVGTDSMLLGSFVVPEINQRILDVGCGTGVLSLMMAQFDPSVRVTGVEMDVLTTVDAKYNFKNSNYSSQIDLMVGDFFETKFSGLYDLIISNPPYYQTTLKATDKRISDAKHIDSTFLDKFFSKCSVLLNDTGCVWIIVPFIDTDLWKEQAELSKLYCVSTINIYSKPSGKIVRTIMCFSLSQKTGCTKGLSFVIRNDDNSYSDEYIELTKHFHAKDLSNT